MATPGEILEELEQLDIDALVRESVEEVSTEYIKKNLDQLYEGLNSEGQKILPRYRSNKYARVKNEMNSAPGLGTPDLFLTGAFYAGSKARLEGDDIVEESSVEYSKDLENRYDPNQIWGLDEENHDEFVNEDLQTLIIEKISEQTGLR